MAVWCVLWWNERDHWGTLRSVLRDPFMSSFVKPGWEAARTVSSSQTLGPDVHTHRDPHPLLLCSNLLQPLFHYCLAKTSAVWTERASSGYLGLIALKVAASNLLDQFKDPHNSPRLHWLHLGQRWTLSRSSGPCGDSCQKEGGVSSVLPPGQAPLCWESSSLVDPTVAAVVVGTEAGTTNECRK